MDFLIWPRTAAFASVMWSEVLDSGVVAEALLTFNGLLKVDNIIPSSLTSEWCEQNIEICYPKNQRQKDLEYK